MAPPNESKPVRIHVSMQTYRDLSAIRIGAHGVKPGTYYSIGDTVQYLLEAVSGTPDLLAKQGELMAGKV